MSPIPFMPLYVADYHADTSHLTTVEHGAYVLLIMSYWQRGKPLPDDDRHLAGIAKMPKGRWLAVRPTMEEFFQIRDGHWHHKRIDAELAKVRARSEQARAAVRKRQDRQAHSTRIESENRELRFQVCESQIPDDEQTRGQNPQKTAKETLRTYNGRTTDVQRPIYYTDTDTDTDTGSKIPPVHLTVDMPPNRPSDPISGQIAEAVEAWNGLARECGLPQCQRLTDARRQKLRKRLSEAGGLDGWRHALDRIRGSPFLRGDNRSGWRADFDFVLQAKSFARLMEGSYDPGDQGETTANRGGWPNGAANGAGGRRPHGAGYEAVIAGARAALGRR